MLLIDCKEQSESKDKHFDLYHYRKINNDNMLHALQFYL